MSERKRLTWPLTSSKTQWSKHWFFKTNESGILQLFKCINARFRTKTCNFCNPDNKTKNRGLKTVLVTFFANLMSVRKESNWFAAVVRSISTSNFTPKCISRKEWEPQFSGLLYVLYQLGYVCYRIKKSGFYCGYFLTWALLEILLIFS